MDSHQNLTGRVALVGVVDDDSAVRNSLKFSLEIDGFVVGLYASGAELLDEQNLLHFACLIVDQNMPGLKGLDVVAKLRERQIFVPVILITTHPSETLIAQAQAARVRIVEKPLIGNVLVDGVRHLIRPPISD